MNYRKYFIRTFDYDILTDMFKERFYGYDKIVDIQQKKKVFKNDLVKDFYTKYETELNSFKASDLKKIYDECKVRIDYKIITKSEKEEPSIVINRYGISYTDFENPNNSYVNFKKEFLDTKRVIDEFWEKVWSGNFKSGEDKAMFTEHDTHIVDTELSIYVKVDSTGKDEVGIFVMLRGNKEYLYKF